MYLNSRLLTRRIRNLEFYQMVNIATLKLQEQQKISFLKCSIFINFLEFRLGVAVVCCKQVNHRLRNMQNLTSITPRLIDAS